MQLGGAVNISTLMSIYVHLKRLTSYQLFTPQQFLVELPEEIRLHHHYIIYLPRAFQSKPYNELQLQLRYTTCTINLTTAACNTGSYQYDAALKV